MKKNKPVTKKTVVKKNSQKPNIAPKKSGAAVKKVVAKKVGAKKVAAKQVAVKRLATKLVINKSNSKKAKPKSKQLASSKAANDYLVTRVDDGPNTIFVQIASYRDPELVPTIVDCIAKAKYPENLRFGICRQFHEMDGFDNLDSYRDDPRFTILDIPWHDTLGLCWARSKIQELYQGEKFTLQLDSHHRFREAWDESLMQMMGLVDSHKPLLTAYCPTYDPAVEKEWDLSPIKMMPGHFTSYGTIAFRPVFIENWQSLEKPIPGRFVSGHFFFTLGRHCLEYKYDPYIYFAGDEISLSIRSWTLGYDIYHPHYSVLTHNYQTYERPRHWDDHSKSKNGNITVDWTETNEAGLRRLRQMLGEENNDIDLGIYGLGNVRSHASYEGYAGIDFSEKKIHPFALLGFDPPTTLDQDWGRHKATYSREVDWGDIKDQLIVDNINKLYIGFDTEDNQSIYSEVHVDPEILSGKKTRLQVSFLYNALPKKMVFYPIDDKDIWVKRVEKLL